MMHPINFFAYTHHEPLAREINACVQDRFQVRQFFEIDKLKRNLRQTCHALLILDLRSEYSLELCRTLPQSRDDLEIIALGEPSTNPMLEADTLGVYACEPLPLAQITFQQVIERAGQDLHLQIEKLKQRERAHFWHNLAVSMTHEVRNPLVSIKTYAELLPEHYDDMEFRTEFSRIVTEEVGKLNEIIERCYEITEIWDDVGTPERQWADWLILADALNHLAKGTDPFTINARAIQEFNIRDNPSMTEGNTMALFHALQDLVGHSSYTLLPGTGSTAGFESYDLDNRTNLEVNDFTMVPGGASQHGRMNR